MNRLFIVFIFAALIAGCDEARRDASEEKDPRVQKGIERVQLKRWDEAIDQFEEALSENPKLARPDLELALIYHQQKKNYVRAIYHYERYLEKRPDSEKKPLIQDWIRQAKISFAAQIGKSSGDISEELIRLTRENNLLRKQLGRTAVAAPQVSTVKTVRTDTSPTLKQPEPLPDPTPTPVSSKPIERIQFPAPTPETYKVLPGDTLTRIAKSIYGDGGQWRKIYEANLNQMKNENDLKAGQTIIIPTTGN